MGLDFIVRAPILASVFQRVGLTGSKALGHLYCKPLSMSEVSTYAEGRLFWDDAANGLAQADGTAYRHVADRIAVPLRLTATEVDSWAFVADRAYKVLGFREVHSVVGGSSAAIRPRKVTAASTEAPGATASATCVELTSAAIDLTATINVAQTPTLVTAGSANVLAAGDKIGIDSSGTLTGIVGHLTIYLEQV